MLMLQGIPSLALAIGNGTKGVLLSQAQASGPRQFTPFWFSVEPVDTLAVRSSPVFLNCSAHSEPPARVEWKKDGTFLNLASDDRRQLLPDGSLLIPSVVHSKHSKPDEGFYQCVATIDSLGTIISRAARLTVAGLPRFSSQPGASSVTQGDSVVLNCDINVDLVPFTRWELDQETLDLDERVVKLPNGTLVISNASEADAGLYRCVVENVGPVKTSDEAELQVLPDTGTDRRLQFLSQPAPVMKARGQDVLLPCVVSGSPAPTVRWMIGDKVIDERPRAVVLDSFQAPPQFLKRPSNIYAYESMDIVFECEVTGTPAPTVKWVKNGDAVIPSDYFKIIKEHNLQVLGLVKSDEGFYQCVAENDVGNIQASAQLIILEHGGAVGSIKTVPVFTLGTWT
ncbi:Neogenin [Acipenser ruthenus]|uniref:Neogenin n=1 Tax=Acipenser ruthenus TaxID=7906 RepID=A0A662YRP3_ACIRT|nr:Neogenin [Acipenser ruthenus]